MFKRILSIILTVILSLSISTYAFDPSIGDSDALGFAHDRVVVKLKIPDTTTSSAMTFGVADTSGMFGELEIEEVKELTVAAPSTGKGGGMRIQSSSQPKAEVLRLTLKNKGERAVLDAVAYLKSLPNVELAEPDFIYSISQVPNDAKYSELWGMTKIAAPAAWDVTTGSADVVVGVLDTGIEYTHPDLAANMLNTPSGLAGFDGDNFGWNFLEDNNTPLDDHSHGTHVAGTIGAVGNNGVGVAGVCWNVKLVSLKVFASDGQGYNSDIVNAVNYCTARGITITNNSYSADDEFAYSDILKQAIADSDQVFVVAAGNDGMDNDLFPSYPSNYSLSNVITVAASDQSDNRSVWSSGGSSNYGVNTVHIAAPGSAIHSTVLKGAYGNKNGTSMAAPHVAGAAALIKSAYPSLTADEIIERIMYNSDVIPALSGVVMSGGRLNVLSALSPVVDATPAINITLDETEIEMLYGEKITLESTLLPPTAVNRRVIWESDDNDVAFVSDAGVVTAKGAGTCTITVRSVKNPSVYAQCEVTVDPRYATILSAAFDSENDSIIVDVYSGVTGIVFMAAYGDDRMLQFFAPFDLNIGVDSYVFENVDIENSEDYGIFIWKDMDSAVPLE